jgi:uncharacterized membrane protein (DUF4010 family)
MLTGILGGLYSSTATTVIIARKEKLGVAGPNAVSAIMIANGMMYLRILFLSFIFNTQVALQLTIPFIGMFLVTLLLSRISKTKIQDQTSEQVPVMNVESNKNPLEFRTAAIFGALFVVFALVTDFILKNYGSSGITGLAYVVGVTDIDPFLLNLLQHKTGIEQITIVLAIINATNSNNLLKMIYAISLSNKSLRKRIFFNFAILIGAGVLLSILIYLL